MPPQDDAFARQGARETSVAGLIGGDGIPSPPCVAGASSPSASPPRPGPPRRRPSSPTTSPDLTADELPIAAVFLTGRPFAEADQRAAGLGWAAIATTVTDLAGVPRAALGEAYDRSSDLGMAVADVLTAAGHAPDPAASPTLPEVAAAYAAIEAASGPAAKGGDPPRPPRPRPTR